jgi:hypothetical protein
MKNKISIILIMSLLVLLGFASLSHANTVTLTDTTNFFFDHTDPAEDLVDYRGLYVNKLEFATDWVGWTHHFAAPDEEPVSATLTVYLRDDIDGHHLHWNQWELGFGIAEDGTWDLGEVDTGPYTYNITASYLMDGTFTVFLGSLLGDFYIDSSKLEITTNAVPIPSSLILMLSGIMALTGIRRRMLKAQVGLGR